MKVDVIIVGGGMVGLATALLLSQNGFDVCLLDIHPCTPTPLPESYDLRVSAITLGTVKLFKNLGIWEVINNLRVGRFEKIKIWEDCDTKNICFEPAKGYIIENKVIQLALIQKSEKIKILAPIQIQAIQKSPDNISVLLDNGQTVTSKLIIGADGANSKIREWAELGLSEKNYDQSALVATVQTEKPHENIARQRFLPEGPLALLPLSQANYCSIVWTSSPEATQKLLGLNPSEFNTAINKYWHDELGEIRLVDQRLAFPLSKKHAEHYVKERVVLVGDAAHTIHHLAGQGVNLGFLDAQALSTILTQAKNKKRDIGLLHTLRRYERSRKGDNILVQKLMDVFNSPRMRKFGVKIVSNIEILKQVMVVWMKRRETS